MATVRLCDRCKNIVPDEDERMEVRFKLVNACTGGREISADYELCKPCGESVCNEAHGLSMRLKEAFNNPTRETA